MNRFARVLFLVGPIVAGLMAASVFEVASIKRSTACAQSGRGSGESVSSDPGRLDLRCYTAMELIRMAYVQYADGKPRSPGGRQTPVSGGPGWIDSDRYDISATAESPQSPETMRGPMLQALLEDRFRVKVHHAAKEVPVYELTVAKGGPKLQAAQSGTCFPPDLPRAERPAGLFPCGVFTRSKTNDGSYMYGTTLANFCAQISLLLDRDVIDKTGIAGAFDIHVETPPPDAAPVDAAGIAPSPADLSDTVIAAVRSIGLRMEPAKGRGDFLVIDRVERPAEN
jgi:uncharacterized protein (TIGR03435 family)